MAPPLIGVFRDFARSAHWWLKRTIGHRHANLVYCRYKLMEQYLCLPRTSLARSLPASVILCVCTRPKAHKAMHATMGSVCTTLNSRISKDDSFCRSHPLVVFRLRMRWRLVHQLYLRNPFTSDPQTRYGCTLDAQAFVWSPIVSSVASSVDPGTASATKGAAPSWSPFGCGFAN